jgi:hypothetical protein
MSDTPREPRNPGADDPSRCDPFVAGEAILARARHVSHRITAKCEQLTGGTQVDLRPLPPGDVQDGDRATGRNPGTTEGRPLS